MRKNNNKKVAEILIVDDELDMLDSTEKILTNTGYRVSKTLKATDAIRMLAKESYDLVITDIVMPDIDGISLIQHIKNNHPDVEIMVMTAYPDESRIDELENLGVHYYIFKPFHKSQLIYSVHGVLHFNRIKELYALDTGQIGLIGISSHIRSLREQIKMYANISSPLLISGPTGTGKELVARGVHSLSDRENNAFIPVNCATLGTLADSELFGHKSGAFTDARYSSLGYFQVADKGILFLDEVGELGLDIQAKLLRAIDFGEVSVVGDPKPVKVDLRIICATNRALKDMVQNGKFREDLYYRLCGTQITTASLNARIDDIPPLVYNFLNSLNEVKKMNCKITLKAIEYLQQYSWPGNVRELKYTVTTLAEMAKKHVIDYDDVVKVLDIQQQNMPLPYKEAKNLNMVDFDKEYFTALLSLTKGKLSKCLEISKLHKKNFYEKLKSCGLK